jgi:hypothetical protein
MVQFDEGRSIVSAPSGEVFQRGGGSEEIEGERPVSIPLQPCLHDLVLCKTAGSFGALHRVAAAEIGVFDKRQAKRTATVLVTSELRCKFRVSTTDAFSALRVHLPIAVSAFSAESNSTTPVPRERPLGSYWISARSTLPIVVKSSTRSSLLVDHGSCDEQISTNLVSGPRPDSHCEHRW